LRVSRLSRTEEKKKLAGGAEGGKVILKGKKGFMEGGKKVRMAKISRQDKEKLEKREVRSITIRNRQSNAREL